MLERIRILSKRLRVLATSIGAISSCAMWIAGGFVGCSDDEPTTLEEAALAACGDGLFCNGTERLVQGGCVTTSVAPCDDGAECTVDTCDEATKTCAHQLVGECATCQAEACLPECEGKECGDDACGGSCGSCPAGEGCASSVGLCVAADQAGTCVAPYPLEARMGETEVIAGNTAAAVHQLVPTCNSTSTAVEDVYTFTLTAPAGIDARASGYDTVLSVRSTCADDTPAATLACTDDSSPPGEFGSRVEALLGPGTYFLVVDGFDSTQSGPYSLQLRFADNCVPQCDGKFCGGSDNCGSDCGACAEGFMCGPDLRCRPTLCEPLCTNADGSGRTCGDDGCLGVCGTCSGADLCVLETGTCQAFAVCDHAAPTCEPGCAEGSFCGSDCVCHGVADAFPDLVINGQRLADEVLIDEITVDESSCAYAEGCVAALGTRKIMRFSVEAINQGQVPLGVPQPSTRPDLFEYSPCHGHYHYSGFADYALLDGAGTRLITGRKQAFCMEDTAQYHQGPNVACNKLYTCDDQGIQAGWTDLYGNGLDCQWLDITDLPPGEYGLQVVLNPSKQFEEMTLDNNTAIVPVVIP